MKVENYEIPAPDRTHALTEKESATFPMEQYRNIFRDIPFKVADENLQKIFLKIDEIEGHIHEGFMGLDMPWYVMLGLVDRTIIA